MNANERRAKRRERLVSICTGLPEVTLEGDRHVRFVVRGRTFAYYLDDHHGDGRVAVCCKAPPGDQEALIATDAERFYRPAYLGRYGWISLRLDLPTIDWDEVSDLVTDGYRIVAPKRLAAHAGCVLSGPLPARNRQRLRRLHPGELLPRHPRQRTNDHPGHES